MAVNASDPAYRAEVVPLPIKALGRRCCAHWGVDPIAFGDRGNLQHTRGYHRSRRYNQIHTPSDYSIQLVADRAGDADWISAFDFTPAAWGTSANRAAMMTITRRMRAAARAHDPRIASLREVAGTEDGHTVVTIDMQTGGNRVPFDLTHLDHLHGSLFRANAADDHTGIFEVMAGIPAGLGEDMNLSDQIPDLGGLTVGAFMRDLWTHTVVCRGLTLDADGVPQRHSADRWTGPHLLTAQTLSDRQLATQVAALTTVVQTMADALNGAGGDINTAAIFAKIDEAVAEIEAKQRDAVADLGEGGATQVRGPQD